MKTRNCHCCRGSGQEIDPVSLGQHMREIRRKAGLTLEILAKRMRVDTSYVSKLELGERTWSDELVIMYRKHCK